jgi:hypothetical protein
MKNLGNATKEQVEQYRVAMIADGWAHEATYGGPAQRGGESEELAMSLSKDGFKCSTLLRGPGYHPRADIVHYDLSFWGPDGLVVTPPAEYSMDALRAGLRRCGYCGATDVDTERILFAGRCCQKCRKDSKLTAREEFPGWTN